MREAAVLYPGLAQTVRALLNPGQPLVKLGTEDVPVALRKQRSLGSERGLATPSPDGKGEMTLSPSMKIMPVDPYNTLGRSCEPAYQVDGRRGLRGDVTRWPKRTGLRGPSCGGA